LSCRIECSGSAGAHDSDFLLAEGKVYVVYMANDVQPGEAPDWPFVYDALSVVDLASGRVEQTVTFAASERVYRNTRLPAGACFVPRILQKDTRTFRVFFASEDPGEHQGAVYLTVTQGDRSDSRKERIMFGRLE
jgi:hypothetical protein